MKNALFLTGAAARISQEVAILDKLQELDHLIISPETTMLAGFSSGALNIAAINACYRKNNPLDWNSYYKKELLFGVNNQKVYKQNRFIPLNTQPLRKTIEEFLSDADLKKVQDLSFQSYILTFSYLRFTTVWISNLFNRHQNVSVSDLMMATTGIPILFPDQPIRNLNKSGNKYTRGRYADGGIGGSFRRFEYHLKRYVKQNDPLDKIYIISPMRQVTDSDYEELHKMIPSADMLRLDLKDIKLLRIFLEMISQNGFDTFIKRFHKWTQKRNIANEIYVCIPKMEANYPILNFNKQEEQYNAVCTWIDQNPDKLAIPLNEYIKQFEKKPLKKLTSKIQRKLSHRLKSLLNKN